MTDQQEMRTTRYDRLTRPLKRSLGRAFLRGPLKPFLVSNRVWIVAFHRVDDLGYSNPLVCGIEEFERFCAFLGRTFEVLTLSEQLDRLGRGDAGGTLSITFDDGYLDNFEKAAPVLEQLGLPATFFVATGFIGTDNVAWWDRELPDVPKWMDWDQVRNLHRRGFQIGCHTVTHADLGSIGVDAVRSEVGDAKRRLERELAVGVDLFAYPYGGPGHMNAASLHVVKEMGLRCSLSCFGGVNAVDADPYGLRRVPINSARGETVDDIAYHLVRNIAPVRTKRTE